MTLVACEGLRIGHRGRQILPAIDLTIRPGRLLAVIGRNGSGKTTLIRTLLGLLRPLGGKIRRARRDLQVAYVPQVSALDDVLPIRVSELVLSGRVRGWGFLRPFATRADRDRRDQAIEAAGAGAFTRRAYRELSQGQKQRALFARMLAMDPELAFLDEPTAAMDEMAEREAMERLKEMTRTRPVGVVIVVHDLALVGRYADDVLFVDQDHQSVVFGDRGSVFADARVRDHYGEIEMRHV